jgi:hypothetical protein
MSELALVEPSRGDLDVNYWTDCLVFAARVAEKVADTEFVSKSLRGRPEAVAAAVMYGIEVGVTPMAALQGIHVVDGRPAPSSELMRALIFAAGHTIAIHEATGQRVRVSGLRKGQPESERFVVEWTMDMARAAGLANKQNWRTYPRAMLMARATGDLARVLFPDVIKGLGYVAEDTAMDPREVPVEERAPEPRKALQRGRRSTMDTDTHDVPLDAPDPPSATAGTSDGRPPVAPPRREETGGPAERADGSGELPPSAPSGRVDEYDVPLPELEPEPSAPEPTSGMQPITPGPLKAIHTLLSGQLGSAATVEEKREMLSAIVGRVVESSKSLTRSEGYRVLDYLNRFENGAASWEMDPETGGITIQDLREPPDDDG